MLIVLHPSKRNIRKRLDTSDSPLSSLTLGFSSVEKLRFESLPLPTEPTEISDVKVSPETPFKTSVSIGERKMRFTLHGLNDDDQLHLRVEGTEHARAWVVRGSDAAPRPRAVCPDGSEDFPCVTCRDGEYSIEICC